ncbi:MAG: M23 family metallopeptidase [Candidatus Chromulinivorax sp.]
MMQYTKFLGFILAGLLCWYVGNNFYVYYYNSSDPVVTIEGIQEGSYFSQEIVAKIIAKHPYKVAQYSIFVDGKPIKENISVGRSHFEQILKISADHLENGKHTFKATATSGSRQSATVEVVKTIYIDNAPLHAAFTQPSSEYKVVQGRCLHVQFQVNKPIKKAHISAFSKEYPAYPQNNGSLIYESFIPVECDQHPSEYALSLDICDHVGHDLKFETTCHVQGFAFKKKTLHIPAGTLDREKEFTNLTEKDFELKMEELTLHSVQEKLWQGVFEVPLAMTAIMTDFGVQRMAQERGFYVHKALDIVSAAPKSVVWACQSGIVVLKDRYVHAGNTIVIDHGYGILSMYFHLDTFADIKIGQKIRKGNPIGTMGKTGYAGGYHLHWEMRVGNVAIDPMQWTKREFIG